MEMNSHGKPTKKLNNILGVQQYDLSSVLPRLVLPTELIVLTCVKDHVITKTDVDSIMTWG